jgi:hypothetical protein
MHRRSPRWLRWRHGIKRGFCRTRCKRGRDGGRDAVCQARDRRMARPTLAGDVMDLGLVLAAGLEVINAAGASMPAALTDSKWRCVRVSS